MPQIITLILIDGFTFVILLFQKKREFQQHFMILLQEYKKPSREKLLCGKNLRNVLANFSRISRILAFFEKVYIVKNLTSFIFRAYDKTICYTLNPWLHKMDLVLNEVLQDYKIDANFQQLKIEAIIKKNYQSFQ